ncbi:MAG TPA: TonB-dependent receptor, partial [Segetibacter sp.]
MKASILLACFILFLSAAIAQSAGKISGSVFKNEKAGEGATVTLLSAKDSTIVKLSVANKEGLFLFEKVAEGKYLVSATAVGYKKSFSNIIHVAPRQEVVEVADLKLSPAIKSLADVTVTASRPLIEQRIDRTIVNVDASITNIGASALEVLEKAPGVTVDRDGNISLKGKEGVQIMIDGRLTQLGGADLANLLRNLSSNQMDQVEIMTNPPARYDAAGNAGVINIKTKKTSTAGYSGSLTATYIQGRYPKANESVNFNYREGKVNVFTNLSHNYRKGFESLNIQRNIINDNSNQLENYFDQQGDKLAEAKSYNAKAGLDYFAGKKTTLGFVVNHTSSPLSVNNQNITDISSPSKVLESVTKASVNNTSDWKSFSSNINFRTLIDAKGKELTSDLDFVN